MLKLNIEELLEKKGKTKYWLWKQTKLTYSNFDNLIKNRTKSIRYENLEKICRALLTKVHDVDEKDDEKTKKSSKPKRKTLSKPKSKITKNKNKSSHT